MSTIGMNHFILEKDEPGFYWYLIDLIETLEGLEERQDYVLGTLHGITYILLNVFETEDSVEYQIGAKQEGAEVNSLRYHTSIRTRSIWRMAIFM